MLLQLARKCVDDKRMVELAAALEQLQRKEDKVDLRISSRRTNANGRGKQVLEANSQHLSQGVANLSLGSEEDNEGWEEVGKKTKNKGGSAQKSNPKAWVHEDDQKINAWSSPVGSQVVNP